MSYLFRSRTTDEGFGRNQDVKSTSNHSLCMQVAAFAGDHFAAV